ncbi:unnamed protein product [Alopecurus aequalis]
MVKNSINKKNNREDNQSERVSQSLLFDGEDSLPLLAFLRRLGRDLLSRDPPRGELQALPADAPAVLIPPAQEIFFRLIHLVIHELEAGYTLKTMSESKFHVTRAHLVKFKVNTQKATTSDEKSGTIHRLGSMLDRVLRTVSPIYLANKRANPELSHLLGLMRDYQDGSPTLFLIQYPFCLLPVSNRAPAYIKFFDHTMDIIRFNDPEMYMLILENIEIPQNWETLFGTNEHLAASLWRGEYDVQTARRPSTFEPQLRPFKFMRHRPSHAQEGAASVSEPRGTQFTPSDLSIALYLRMPFAFVSFAKSLHFIGELENIDGFLDLFPGLSDDSRR